MSGRGSWAPVAAVAATAAAAALLAALARRRAKRRSAARQRLRSAVRRRRAPVASSDVSRQADALNRIADEPYPYPRGSLVAQAPREVDVSFVDSVEALRAAVSRFADAAVLGVDIENHRFYSYEGVACLLQVSDGHFTAVIDAIVLRDHVYAAFRDVLLSPAVVKVLHAPSNDLLWLQRDFGLLAANVFDTQAAQAALGRSSSSSLADLWAIHTRHRMSAAEKRRLQSSDWRTRPLSDEQLRYAAADASLLPCVYASQLAALSRAGVDLALLRSQAATLCRRRYELPSFDREDARRRFWQLAPDTAHGLDQAAVACAEGAFVAAMQWRDSVAQELDVSLRAVAPWRLLLRLACSKAARGQDVRATAERHGSLPLLEERADELAALLRQAPTLPPLAASMPGSAARSPTSSEQAAARKVERTQKRIRQFAAKRPVYENCRMLSPSGAMLCFCDRKKVRWYLSKGLATLEQGSLEEEGGTAVTIRLTFQPNTKQIDHRANQFYLQQKDNRCVACGDYDHFLRYHIVPRCYRQHFPESHKSHRSHDIVLLCLACHNRANQHATRVKARIAEETGISEQKPVPEADRAKQVDRTRRTAVALLQAAHKMPAERQAALQRRLLALLACIEHSQLCARLPPQLLARTAPPDPDSAAIQGRFTQAEVTKAGEWAASLGEDCLDEAVVVPLLEWAAALKPPPATAASVEQHGRLVVSQLDDLEGFVRMWRREFIEAMRPRYLPPQWGVNHQVSRTFGDRSVFHRSDASEDRPTRFRGVRQRGPAAFTATLSLPGGGTEEVGTFATAEAAARAYDARAVAAYGSTALVNDPDGDDRARRGATQAT